LLKALENDLIKQLTKTLLGVKIDVEKELRDCAIRSFELTFVFVTR